MRPIAAALALALALPVAAADKVRAVEPPVLRGPAAPAGTLEAGRLLAAGPPLTGPFVLSWLEPGTSLELRAGDDPKAPVLGVVTGPLSTPFLLPAGSRLALGAGASGALYSGARPAPLLQLLEAWVGRQVIVDDGSDQSGAWTLRQVAPDHLILERNRTFRALAAARVQELTWTELSGIDPTPRIKVAAP